MISRPSCASHCSRTSSKPQPSTSERDAWSAGRMVARTTCTQGGREQRRAAFLKPAWGNPSAAERGRFGNRPQPSRPRGAAHESRQVRTGASSPGMRTRRVTKSASVGMSAIRLLLMRHRSTHLSPVRYGVKGVLGRARRPTTCQRVENRRGDLDQLKLRLVRIWVLPQFAGDRHPSDPAVGILGALWTCAISTSCGSNSISLAKPAAICWNWADRCIDFRSAAVRH